MHGVRGVAQRLHQNLGSKKTSSNTLFFSLLFFFDPKVRLLDLSLQLPLFYWKSHALIAAFFGDGLLRCRQHYRRCCYGSSGLGSVPKASRS